jgi:hypothetical protein
MGKEIVKGEPVSCRICKKSISSSNDGIIESNNRDICKSCVRIIATLENVSVIN